MRETASGGALNLAVCYNEAMIYRLRTVQVWAVAAALFGIFGIQYAYATAPTYAPCCLQLTPTSASNINLTWVAVSSAPSTTGYKIERESPLGGGFTTIAYTTSTATTYTDSNLLADVVYGYRVSAINSEGVGPASPGGNGVSTLKTPILFPPSAPQNVAATVKSISQIDVTWSAAESVVPITSYQVDREFPVGGGFMTVLPSGSSTATKYSDTNVSLGQTFNYKVKAFSANGQSPFSRETAVTMPDRLSTPLNVQATAGDSQAAISWAPPPFPNGPITGYTIVGTPTSSATVGGQVTSTVITGLANGTSYFFDVSAVNIVGQGTAARSDMITPRAVPSSSPSSSPLAPSPSSSPVQSVFVQATAIAAASSSVELLQVKLDALTALYHALLLKAKELRARLPSSTAEQASSPAYERDLGFGSSGDDVKALQLFLIGQKSGPMAQKLSEAGANGYFGYNTKRALLEYQKIVGIKNANGHFGPATRALLNGIADG